MRDVAGPRLASAGHHIVDRHQNWTDFGRTFRQNTILYCRDAKPELIVTDPTCDEIGKVFSGNWRLRT